MSRKSIQAASILFGLAAMAMDTTPHAFTQPAPQPKKRKPPPRPKGLKPFEIDGQTIWAINEKNARRKAGKK